MRPLAHFIKVERGAEYYLSPIRPRSLPQPAYLSPSSSFSPIKVNGALSGRAAWNGMWSFSLSELAIPGAEVGRISASDSDVGENARLEYTILEGEAGDTFNITGVNQEAVIVLNKPTYTTFPIRGGP
ncbi:unnamed protein product [Arctogadus glacialis]